MILPPTYSEKGIYAVIETPKGSRSKFYYNKETRSFALKKILPAGTSFPVDFGFIPNTLGDDGDPLDILVFCDSPLYPGCVVECRIVGILLTLKEKKGKVIRNDRVLAIASESLNYSDIKDIKDINENLLNELVHFFNYYNEMEGKEFHFLKKGNSVMALDLIKKGLTS